MKIKLINALMIPVELYLIAISAIFDVEISVRIEE